MLGTPEPEAEKPQTPKDIFRETIAEAARLDQEADRAIEEGRTEEYKDFLRKRVQLVVDLPTRIETTEQSNSFPSDELESLKHLAQQGKEVLERNGIFPLSAFLTPKESRTGDPNLLEEVYQRVYGLETEESE